MIPDIPTWCPTANGRAGPQPADGSSGGVAGLAGPGIGRTRRTTYPVLDRRADPHRPVRTHLGTARPQGDRRTVREHPGTGRAQAAQLLQAPFVAPASNTEGTGTVRRLRRAGGAARALQRMTHWATRRCWKTSGSRPRRWLSEVGRNSATWPRRTGSATPPCRPTTPSTRRPSRGRCTAPPRAAPPTLSTVLA